MSVETFKICRRCQRIQQAALVIVALWLAHGASGITDNALLRVTLQSIGDAVITTDAGGVVYHARYLHFLERARTEWLRSCGYEQGHMSDAIDMAEVYLAMLAKFNAR